MMLPATREKLPEATRKAMSLYELTHGIDKEEEKVPFWLKIAKEGKMKYFVNKNIHDEEDYIKYLKEECDVKAFYYALLRDRAKFNCNLHTKFYDSLSGWMEQKAKDGLWEL